MTRHYTLRRLHVRSTASLTLGAVVCLGYALPAEADDDIDTHLLAILLPTLLGILAALGVILGLLVWYQRRRARHRRARRQQRGVDRYAEADDVAMEPGVEISHRGDSQRMSATVSRRPTPPTLRHADNKDDGCPELHGHADQGHRGAQDRDHHNNPRHDARSSDGDERRDGAHSASSGTHSPTPLPGVAIENRVRPRNHLPKGTVVVEQEDLQYRIDFNRLHDIPEAAPPPLSREERQRLKEEEARIASPLFYGRAEYLHDAPYPSGSRSGSVRGFGSYAPSYAGSVDGRASVDAFRTSANGSPFRPQELHRAPLNTSSGGSGGSAGSPAHLTRQDSANSMASMGSLANASFGEARRHGKAPRSRDPNIHAMPQEYLESTSDDFDGMEGIDDEAAMAVRAGLRQRHTSATTPHSGQPSLSLLRSSAQPPPPSLPQQSSLSRDAHSPHHHDLHRKDAAKADPPHVNTRTREALLAGTANQSAGSSLRDIFAGAPASAVMHASVPVLDAHITPVTAAPPQIPSLLPTTSAPTSSTATTVKPVPTVSTSDRSASVPAATTPELNAES